jgi:O-antigen/teichoic acid export membrane protein
VTGGVWLFSFRIANTALAYVRKFILARLLAPEDFGLFAIALLAVTTAEAFSQTGFNPALVQKKNNIDSYLNTAWTVMAIRGIFLFLLIFLAAPVVADFFVSPSAVLIIRVIAVTALLNGFKNIGIVYLEKELDFSRLVLFQLAGTLANFCAALTLAVVLQNAWALVCGGLAAALVQMLMSYILHPYRPKLELNWEKLFDLLSFGKWVFGYSALIFLLNNGDDVLVGKMLGAQALGLYQMAFLIASLPTTEISHSISRIMYPAYSKLQSDLVALKAVYLSSFQVTVLISLPMGACIFLLGPDFAKELFNPKWMPMLPALKILVFWGVLRSTGALFGSVFKATGRPYLITRLQVIKLLLLIVMIVPLTKLFGIVGTSFAIVANALIINPCGHYVVNKILGIRAKDLLKILILPTIGTTVLCSYIILLKQMLVDSAGIFTISGIVVSAALIYGIIIIMFKKASICKWWCFLCFPTDKSYKRR